MSSQVQKRTLLWAFKTILLAATFFAQKPTPILIADQTLTISENHEFSFALAEGDDFHFHLEMISGRKLKSVEVTQFPGNVVFRAQNVDSVLDKSLTINQMGIYQVRLSESGFGKKTCRFVLKRTPGSAESLRFDSRVAWDLAQSPNYVIKKRSVPVGRKIEVLPSGGKVTVPASKLGLANPVASYQFSLPPDTKQWAYRVSVGQATVEARRRDAEKLSSAVRSTSLKLVGFEPETALAAFALGLAVDMGTSKAGEDVQYFLMDAENARNFREGKTHSAFVEQSSVSLDAQRRYAPLSGELFFLLKNDNWVDDIEVSIEIEAVTEREVFADEVFLEAVRD